MQQKPECFPLKLPLLSTTFCFVCIDSKPMDLHGHKKKKDFTNMQSPGASFHQIAFGSHLHHLCESMKNLGGPKVQTELVRNSASLQIQQLFPGVIIVFTGQRKPAPTSPPRRMDGT